jgi:hypothetical protein
MILTRERRFGKAEKFGIIKGRKRFVSECANEGGGKVHWFLLVPTASNGSLRQFPRRC